MFQPPVGKKKKKKNHLQNYVDSPLCRERQLISCSKAGSWVKSGAVVEGLITLQEAVWLSRPGLFALHFANATAIG